MTVATVTVPIELPHPPAEAWKDLTEGARLSLWFAQSGDLGPGGSFRFDFGDGDFFLGQVTRWEPERALGLEWRFMGLGPTFQIRFDLMPGGSGTKVQVEDRGARTAAEADSLREGWRDFLQRLRSFASTGANCRYEWSPTIGTAALVGSPPPRVAQLLRDPGWWRAAFGGAEPGLSSPGELQVAADFRGAAWAGAGTRAVATVEAAPEGAYVGVTHAGWESLPPSLQIPERRRFAGLWAEALGRLERAS